MFTVAYGTWADGMILAVQLIFLYILTHFFDSVDDITFVDYCKSPVPSCGATRGGCRWDCARSDAPRRWRWGSIWFLRNTAAAKAAAPLYTLFVYLLAGLVVCGIRLFQIWPPNRKWSRQRLVEDGSTHRPRPQTRIFQAIVLPLSLFLFGAGRFCKTGYLDIIPNLIWAVLVLVRRERAALPILSAGGSQPVPADRRHTSALCVAQAETAPRSVGRAGTQRDFSSYRLVGHPFLSLLSQRFLFGLFVVDTRGNSLARRHRLLPAQVRGRRSPVRGICLRSRHTFRFRMAPHRERRPSLYASGRADGRPVHQLPRAFSCAALSRMTCPLQPNSAGAPGRRQYEPTESEIMPLSPPPAQLYVRAPQGLAELDNGSEVYGYQVWSGGAFFRFLERMYTGD